MSVLLLRMRNTYFLHYNMLILQHFWLPSTQAKQRGGVGVGRGRGKGGKKRRGEGRGREERRRGETAKISA